MKPAEVALYLSG